MPRVFFQITTGLLLLCCLSTSAQENKKSPRDALQPLNGLIGEWKGTGMPLSADAKKKGFWIEKMDWSWQFKGDQAWMTVKIGNGKYFTSGKLEFLPDTSTYQLTLDTPEKNKEVFTGTKKDDRLTLERIDPKTKEKQQLIFRFLHANRFLYQYQVAQAGRTFFKREYQVGATKEGVPFAQGNGQPECIVSGGLGTITVSYKGETYYVCCSGCKDEFEANPEMYIKEWNEKKAKK